MIEVPIIETSQLVCSGKQWTGFYVTGTSVMKKLKWENFTYVVVVRIIIEYM